MSGLPRYLPGLRCHIALQNSQPAESQNCGMHTNTHLWIRSCLMHHVVCILYSLSMCASPKQHKATSCPLCSWHPLRDVCD